MPRHTQVMPDAPGKKLVSIDKAAAYADVSTRSIWRWIASGHLTGYRAGPKLVRVDLNELDANFRPIPTADRTA